MTGEGGCLPWMKILIADSGVKSVSENERQNNWIKIYLMYVILILDVLLFFFFFFFFFFLFVLFFFLFFFFFFFYCFFFFFFFFFFFCCCFLFFFVVFCVCLFVSLGFFYCFLFVCFFYPKHYEKSLFKYLENFISKKLKIFREKTDIFHISIQNIDCGYSLEPPQRGGSNVYLQSMFLRKIMLTPVLLYKKWGLRGGGGQNYIGTFRDPDMCAQ